MGVTVKLRYIRHSAKKLRPYARLFAGTNLEQSINKSMLMPQDSAKFIHKALKMAQAAAVAKEFDSNSLQISTIMADEGPRIKRMRPNAKGRSNKYQKHIAHLTVTVDAESVAPEKKNKPKKVAARMSKEK